MAELWEIILPIVGAGIVGYVIRWFEEKRKRMHEKEVEYRKELKKHLPDLIEPLFKLLGDLWYGLIELSNPDRVKYSGNDLIVKGRKLISPLKEVEDALVRLNGFVKMNEERLDFILPHPLQSWQYTHLNGFISKIIKDARRGKIALDNLAEVIETIMNIQSDLQKVVGFETKIRLKSERAFENLKPLSRFEKLKRKLKLR